MRPRLTVTAAARKQLQQVGKVRDRVVARYKDAGDDQYLLGTAVARVDRGFARLRACSASRGPAPR